MELFKRSSLILTYDFAFGFTEMVQHQKFCGFWNCDDLWLNWKVKSHIAIFGAWMNVNVDFWAYQNPVYLFCIPNKNWTWPNVFVLSPYWMIEKTKLDFMQWEGDTRKQKGEKRKKFDRLFVTTGLFQCRRSATKVSKHTNKLEIERRKKNSYSSTLHMEVRDRKV